MPPGRSRPGFFILATPLERRIHDRGSKLERQNLDANGWKGGLRGGDVYLVTASALRLGGRNLLTSAIHNEVLEGLASYDEARRAAFGEGEETCPSR